MKQIFMVPSWLPKRRFFLGDSFNIIISVQIDCDFAICTKTKYAFNEILLSKLVNKILSFTFERLLFNEARKYAHSEVWPFRVTYAVQLRDTAETNSPRYCATLGYIAINLTSSAHLICGRNKSSLTSNIMAAMANSR